MPRANALTALLALASLAAALLACGPNRPAPGAAGAEGTTSTAAAASATATANAPASTAATGASARPEGTSTPQAQRTPTPGPARAAIVPGTPSQRAPRADRSGFVVALDAGHGGDESGAAANGVVERDSNLDLAQRVGGFLAAAGVQVYYTRADGGRAAGIGGSGDTRSLTREDLQARVIGANRAGADVFVSLHSNGAADTSLRGVEVYYESRRPFADENYRLAQQLLDGALRGLASAGHPSTNRGIIDAACWRNFQGRCVGLFVLSPGGATAAPGGGTTTQVKEATNMPAALLETLFVSSPDDAALLRDDAVRTAIARGIADGILRYLGVLT